MIDYILLENYARNKSVLIAEDDDSILKETKEFLELIFSKVDIARDGKEAIEKFNNFFEKEDKFYDLIITDIQMPNLNGVELSKYIYSKNKNQLLIVLSAHSESNYLLELINIGISHFITKPLNYDTFVHIIFTKLKELNENCDNEIIQMNKILTINSKLKWDKENKHLYLNDTLVKLTKKEIMLLELLLKYSEKTHTVEEILNRLWIDDNIAPDIKNLKNIISRLRKKVPSLDIENIYGFGYRVNLK